MPKFLPLCQIQIWTSCFFRYDLMLGVCQYHLQFTGLDLLKNLDSTAVRRETKMNRIKVGLEAESLKPDA